MSIIVDIRHLKVKGCVCELIQGIVIAFACWGREKPQKASRVIGILPQIWTPINVRSCGGVCFQVDANFILICNILKPSWCEVILETNT